MDWHLAIEKNGEALKGILVMLVAMTGLPILRTDAGGRADWRPGTPTLPRHLHRYVLRLLRPAESAVRRLIIVAARGLVVEVSRPRLHKPKTRSLVAPNRLGIAMVIAPGTPLPQPAAPRPVARRPSLPLFDPLKRFGVRRRYVKPRFPPRITFDFDRPREPAPLPPSPDDPLDAGRLNRRIEALALALDDLPRQAKRLARWQVRRDARLNQEGGGGADRHPTPALRADPPPRGEGSDPAAAPGKPRHQRFSPMRPGRPPGWRRRPDHPVYEVLTEMHGLAVWAQERPDTS